MEANYQGMRQRPVSIVVSERIKVSVASLPPMLAKKLNERLVFINPEYEFRQSRGEWLGNVPPQIHCLYEQRGSYFIPRGFLTQLLELCQHFKVKHWNKFDEFVKNKLSMVGLEGFQNFYPANLSGGQRKRVALARAIALNPEVILYDEPTTGLDPIRSDVINELILKLQRELGVTSVVVTHDMTSAYKIADRIIMLHHGKIVADGDAEHIRNHPHPVVQQFINGQVSEDDLAVLRMSGTISQAQFLPRDFEA